MQTFRNHSICEQRHPSVWVSHCHQRPQSNSLQSSPAVRAQHSPRATVRSLPLAATNEVLVNTTTVNDQSTLSVAGFSDGCYVIAWASNGQDGSGLGVYAQTFNDAGAKVNAEFLVNTTTAGDQS